MRRGYHIFVVCNVLMHFNSICIFGNIIYCFKIILWYKIDIGSNPYVIGLQKKGKFACPICGPRMKSFHLKFLGKEVFYEFSHFLHKNHRYRTT
jgi:hypothetical protein